MSAAAAASSGVFEHLVVVDGMPGAGKTWLSERLAPLLGYPLLCRDAIKEAMYDALPKPADVDDLAWSRTVGKAAFDVFLRIAPALGPRLILDAHFQRRFGGDADVRAFSTCPTELFVYAPAEVIHSRHHARQVERHRVHQPYPLPTVADIEDGMQFFAPLDVGGPVLEIDTSEPVDVEAIARWVKAQGR